MKSKLVWNLLISAALLFSLLAGPVAAQAADGADSLTLYSSLLAADSRIGMTAAPGEGFESGSAWRSNKNLVEFYLIPQALGLGDITVGDIVSVSYATKKLTVPEGSADVDFGFYIYTEVDEDADSSWYGKRLTAEPYFAKDYDAPADQWNVWTTAGEKNVLTFYDTNNNGGLHGTYTDPTLAELLAGPYTWPNGKTVDYSSEKVMAFKFGTGSAWSAGFDGLLDSITIETTTKKVTIDLEAALPDVVYVDDDWALPSPEEWARLPFAGEGLYPGSNAFSTIQDAIAAVAPGGTVYVNGGEYVEQLVIDKSVKMVGAGVDATTVKAPASLPKSTNMASAIVMIKGEGVEVELSDLTVSGPGPSGCNSIAAGIAVYEGAYANIHDNRIADIRDEKDGGMSGCQNGSAIIVGSQTYGTTGTADITNNEVVRYQKRGILVENDGSSATITGNTVTGVGTTDIIGQNGIQVHYGANAILTGNTVTNNSYHKEGNDADWEASGILLWYSGDVTLAGGNEISGNDVSVYVQDTGTLTVGNEVFGPSSAPAEKALDFEYYGTGPVDLSEVTFAGAADDYDIERLVWHKIDDPALGMVEWVKGQVFAYDNDSLVAALNNAPEGSTINLKAGEYELGLTTIDRDLTVIGENKETTIIKPAQHTPGGANNRFWIGVNEGVEFNLSNVTLDGNNTLVNSKGEEVPVKVYEAIRYNGTGTFENNIVQNIWYGRVTGIGVEVRGNAVIRNNTFENIERIGIHIVTSAVESALIEGNTITGKGDVYDTVNYGVELGAGAKATIRNNTITNNLGFAASDGSESGAIYVTTYFAEGTEAVIEGNTLYNNYAGIYVGYDANDTSTVTARNNKIYDNTFAVITTAPQVIADHNYWGSAGGPLAGSL